MLMENRNTPVVGVDSYFIAEITKEKRIMGKKNSTIK